ncbi:hypothetical protein MIDIC_90002 [Alphaproteobacteria bacterium]
MAEFLVSSCTAWDQSAPKVAGLSDSGFVIAWESRVSMNYGVYGVYGQRYGANGSPAGSQFPVSICNSDGLEDRPSLSIAGLSNGGFVVACTTGSVTNYDVHGQRYDANSSSLGSGFLVNTYTSSSQQDPSVAGLSSGGFVVVWKSFSQGESYGYSVYGQMYGANGFSLGSEFKVHSSASQPSVASLSDGGFFVAYIGSRTLYDSEDIYGQRYDASGTSVGPELKINTYVGSTQDYPSVVGLKNGGFIVTWNSFGQDGTPYSRSVYGQEYDASGSALGSEFRVNTYTKNTQDLPSVAGLNGGSFVVTWESFQDASGYGIYGQRYSASGSALGLEFLVNSRTSGDQEAPSVASLSNGGFVVAWHESNNAKYGIYGQIYDANGRMVDPAPTPTPSVITPYVYARLSDDAYNDVSVFNETGWSVLKSSTDADVIQYFNNVSIALKGYCGRAYENIANKAVVIAHGGTQGPEDQGSVIKQMLSATLDQFPAASAFIDYVKDYILKQGKNVQDYSFTGHSLGASIAELSSACYKYKAITFDSLGTGEVILTALSSADLAFADANVITYNAAPNFINTVAPHVGGIYRVYPSVDVLSKMGYQPWEWFYFDQYTFGKNNIGQHRLFNTLGQFNDTTGQPKVIGLQSEWPSGSLVGYNGYDHYRAYDVNTYYWNSYIEFRSKTEGIASYIVAELVKGKTTSSNIWDMLFFSYPAHGVNITGDNSSNTIWGTTNFDDIIKTGTGNDIIYFHGGNDKSFDIGGDDTYVCPVKNMGKKIIDDSDGQGSIKIGGFYLCSIGNPIYVLPITGPLCPMMSSNTYSLNAGNVGSYYFIEQGGNLSITRECANTVQDIKNSITLLHFSWGNFGINKYTGTDQIVLVGSNGADRLDCSVYKATAGRCFASALDGDDILIAEVGQNAVLTSGDGGKTVFKLLSSVHRLLSGLEIPSNMQNVIEIAGIKEGDVIDLSAIANASSLVIKQNGTDAYVDLGSGNVIHSQISLGNSYVHFNSTGGNITISNLNMTQIISSTIGNIFYDNTTNTETSWWTLGKILGVASGGVGALVIAGLGIFFAHKYHVCCFAVAVTVVTATARAEAKVISHNDVNDGSYMLHHQYDDHPLGNHQNHEDVGVHH